ncbi:Uncharacterized conserved protein PhnB, glyoxalase superfamily [Dyadobacter soli]|uniref:Uncharacterized conserved protein PhnB, glyoxalase superfamily n=1 Tax=Dyadobacter soli TaxID=659014 RepID=A0A1G7FW18_9BACT|nr:VOC family protein [Dyadobacter soli]SDE79935.1 Uncharacterized conserved protein PhnB, glyoxalase superfamily [Dyadobacter soli]
MIVPLFKVSNMADAIRHYTEVLDFEMTDPNDHADSPVVDLGRNGSNMQLTTSESENLFGSVVYFWVENVDALFKKYKERGLDTSLKAGSPVHQGPVDQTWGRREFYITDADGNTVRFFQPIG